MMWGVWYYTDARVLRLLGKSVGKEVDWMLGTRLIMLEGLPGTGKSTNSAFLNVQLERNAYKPCWVHEVACPHPTLFISEACLTYDEYGELLKGHAGAASALNSIAVHRRSFIGVDLTLAQWMHAGVIGEQAFVALRKYDVWDFSLDRYAEVTLDKWAHFVDTAMAHRDTVYVLDSSIFQYQIFRYLLKNAPYERMERFVHKLLGIIKPLAPVLIYFYRDDTEATIDYIEADRGARFLEFMWNRDKAEPYYADKPEGANGHKCFLRDYARWAKTLFNSADCEKTAIEITKADWPRYEAQLLLSLGIEFAPDPSALPPNGVYRNDALDMEIIVEGLTMRDPTGKLRKLTPKSRGEFYVECLPVVLDFAKPGYLLVSGGQICERWTMNGTLLAKSC